MTGRRAAICGDITPPFEPICERDRLHRVVAFWRELAGIKFIIVSDAAESVKSSIAELIEMMVEDPETQVIQLFLETIRSHETLRRAAMKAHAANKPILAYRLGRSAIGQNLAVSHTGALTGNGKATSAFLRDIGIAELSNFEALLDAPALFRHGRGAGSRIGVMSTTGGGGALIVDNLGERHIDVVSPTPQMQANLARKGIEISDAPLVDLTLAGTNAATYGAGRSECVQSPDIDAVVAVVGSSSQFRPERAVAPILDIPSSKPVAVFLTPNAERSRHLLREAGVAVFSQPEACADALSAWARWQEPRHHTGGGPTTVKALDGRAPGQTLSSVDSQQVFASLGIPQAQEWALPPEPVSWDALLLGQVLFPCVLKISEDSVTVTPEGGEPVTLPLENIPAMSGSCLALEQPREAMGLGDANWMACVGAFLGWKAVLFAIFGGSILGATVSLLMILLGRREWAGRIPFGPYLAAGAVIWLFTGPEFLEWYLALARGPAVEPARHHRQRSAALRRRVRPGRRAHQPVRPRPRSGRPDALRSRAEKER